VITATLPAKFFIGLSSFFYGCVSL